MMKRVGLSRFSPLEVSRKVQQCLRFEGVNANGVARSNGVNSEIPGDTEPNDRISNCCILADQCCDDAGSKSNILTAIKRKLKRTKRNKRYETRGRSDSLSNMCQCHSENCALHACCKNNYRPRKQKSGDKSNVWPIASSILRCQNHQKSGKDRDDVAELLPSQSSLDDAEICTCFPSPEPNCMKTKATVASCSNISLSNISCDVSPSLTLAVTAESRFSALDVCIEDNSTYAVPSIEIVKPESSEAGDLTTPRVGNLTQELYKLSKYGWYWGPINRSEAESKLVDQPDGAFLVRDSSDDRYILSLSFRSYGKTLHTRIEHSNGLFSFYAQPEPEGHASIIELIQQSMCYSQSGVFCYSRSRSPGSPSFPVRLTKPISRFTQVRSLQYLCRFVIRQYTRYDHIQKLPLPPRIKGYLEEGHY